MLAGSRLERWWAELAGSDALWGDGVWEVPWRGEPAFLVRMPWPDDPDMGLVLPRGIDHGVTVIDFSQGRQSASRRVDHFDPWNFNFHVAGSLLEELDKAAFFDGLTHDASRSAATSVAPLFMPCLDDGERRVRREVQLMVGYVGRARSDPLGSGNPTAVTDAVAALMWQNVVAGALDAAERNGDHTDEELRRDPLRVASGLQEVIVSTVDGPPPLDAAAPLGLALAAALIWGAGVVPRPVSADDHEEWLHQLEVCSISEGLVQWIDRPPRPLIPVAHIAAAWGTAEVIATRLLSTDPRHWGNPRGWDPSGADAVDVLAEAMRPELVQELRDHFARDAGSGFADAP